MRRCRLVLVGLLLALGGSGCSVFDESLVQAEPDGGDQVEDADMPDTGPDRIDSGTNSGIGCTMGSRLPPTRPPATAEGPDGEEIVYGLREVRLDQAAGDAWREIGLNLDGYCSVPPVPQGECQPPNETSVLPIDGEQGIDNAFGKDLYPLVAAVFPGLQETVRASSLVGIGVVAVRIRKYNGERNDPRVDVILSQSVSGFRGEASETEPPEYSIVDFQASTPDGTESLPPPVWEGNDWLVLRSDTFLLEDVDRPLVRDENAYVADGVLVMSLPERVEIRFAGDDNGITVKLTDARAIGRLSDDLTQIEDVVFAGRWAINDMLQTTASLGVCPGDAEFTIFSNKLDSTADLRSDSRTAGEGVTCDAISLAVTFQGSRARIAGITDGQQPPSGCP